jgi:hypothetical protein
MAMDLVSVLVPFTPGPTARMKTMRVRRLRNKGSMLD